MKVKMMKFLAVLGFGLNNFIKQFAANESILFRRYKLHY